VHSSFPYADERILSWIFDQLEVRDRIAVDEQQVRERAFLHNTELAVMRAAQAGKREQVAPKPRVSAQGTSDRTA